MRFLIKYSFITIFVSVATAIYILCFTTQGLVIDLRCLAAIFPGTLKVEKIKGTLFSDLSLETVTYQDQEETINLKSLQLSWHPEQLLQGKLAIDSLILEQPQIILLSTDAAPSSFSFDDFSFMHRININHLVIHQLSIQKSDLRLDVTGELDNSWNFHWKLNAPKLNTISADYAGSLTGSGSILGERKVPMIDATIQGNNLVASAQKIGRLKGDAHIIIQPKITSTIHVIASQLKINDNVINKMDFTVSGNMAYENNTLLTEAKIAFTQKPEIFLTAALPDFSGFINPEQKIKATIKLNLTELDGLKYFIPEIQNPRGILQGDLSVMGTISKPIMLGTLNLKEGHVAIHALGIHLNDIVLTSVIDKSNIISIQGSLRSGKGVGRLYGTIDLNNPLFPVAFTLQGNNLNALHIPKFKFAISPDVKLSFIYPDLVVQGKVLVSKAVVKLKNYINTVSLPDETIFVDAPQVKTPSILTSAKLHLAIDLGHDFYFNYTDLETRLGGQLVIDKSPNSPATAIGEVNAIKGAYTIYGQNLVIKTGRLIYAGNLLTNPGLNIEAIRKVKNVNAGSNASMPTLESYEGADTTVGVRIIGTAENPQITLFSIPAGLTKEQILSSLGGEGAALMGAISALNPRASKVGNMTDKLTKMLGLTEMNIAPVQTFDKVTNQMQSTPSFIVGKKISKKLSIHYSIGIFNPISIFNVRYQFNKNWAIQSETSTIENGADILYGFERA